MFFCRMIIKFLAIYCCAFMSCNLITCLDSLLNRTSFLQFFKAFLSSSERLCLTSFGLVLQNASLSTEVKNVSSSDEFDFCGDQLNFCFFGLFSPVLFLKLLLLFSSLVPKKSRLLKLFLNLSKSFCKCNQL